MRWWIVCSAFFFLGAAPSSLKTYQDSKHKFRIEYPAKWKVQTPEKKEAANPILVSFAKPDQSILITLLKNKGSAKFGAVEFLNQMDEARKAANLIPEKERKLPAEIVKKTGADEGSIGYYEIPGKNPVLQRALVLKKKDEIYLLTGTFQKSREADDDALVESLLTSFQFSP